MDDLIKYIQETKMTSELIDETIEDAIRILEDLNCEDDAEKIKEKVIKLIGSIAHIRALFYSRLRFNEKESRKVTGLISKNIKFLEHAEYLEILIEKSLEGKN